MPNFTGAVPCRWVPGTFKNDDQPYYSHLCRSHGQYSVPKRNITCTSRNLRILVLGLWKYGVAWKLCNAKRKSEEKLTWNTTYVSEPSWIFAVFLRRRFIQRCRMLSGYCGTLLGDAAETASKTIVMPFRYSAKCHCVIINLE